MTTYPGIYLTASLQEGNEAQAVDVLTAYWTPLAAARGFTGGAFDDFDPSGTRAESEDVFTADDLVSVSLLSVRVPGPAAVDILGPRAKELSSLLAGVGSDRDLVEVESIETDYVPVLALWRALRGIKGLGPTTVSKLMARKRPRLIPIYDKVIKNHLLHGSKVQWAPLHAALRQDGSRLHNRMLELRQAAGLSDAISALRVLDVLAWMDGSGNTERVLQGRSVVQPPEDPADLDV